MEHDRCLELLSARLDGPLTGGEERELEDHLRTCPQCRALAEQLEQLHAGFAGLEELEAPAGFTGRVMERIGGERKVIPLFRRPQFRALAGLAACLAICVGIYGLGQGGGRDLPAGGTALLQSDGADLSVQPYMFAPEDEGDVQTRKDGVWTAQAPAPEGDSASVEGAGVAPRAQTAAPEGEAEVILTVSRLPEGARELLGDGVSETYSAETGQETFTLSSLEQLEQIEALAQAQGITAGRFNGESGTGIFLLVVAGA